MLKKFRVTLHRHVDQTSEIEIWANNKDNAEKSANENYPDLKWDSGEASKVDVTGVHEVDLGEPMLDTLKAQGWEEFHTGGGCMAMYKSVSKDLYYMITDTDAGLDIYEREWLFCAYDEHTDDHIWFTGSESQPSAKLSDFLATLKL